MKRNPILNRLVSLLGLAWFALQMNAQVNGPVTGNQYFHKMGQNPLVLQDFQTLEANSTQKNPISKAFDGDRKSWWGAGIVGDAAITIEFKNMEELRGLHILGHRINDNREMKVKVEASSDGASWSEVETLENPKGHQEITYQFQSPVTTKWLRLTITPRNPNAEVGVFEITLFRQIVDDDRTHSVSINHKPAKWYDLRKSISQAAQNIDTFDDSTPLFTLQYGQVQASHVYMDTIYVHKGQSVKLSLPDRLNNSISIPSYQRWYSFRTDGTYRTRNKADNEVWDLLTPPADFADTPYRFENGYVGKPLTGGNLLDMNFYVPTDEEFKQWFGNDAAQTFDNNYYMVACDVSGYTDFTPSYSAESQKSQFYPSNQADGKTYEPTLVHRVLFYITAVDGRDPGTNGDTETWRNGMGRLKKKEYQGGTSKGQYLEEYNISFPLTRVSNKTKELVALANNASAYAIPDKTIDEDHSTLDVKLVDNTSGIKDVTSSLSGENRVIQFNYPNKKTEDGTEYVHADHSKATILVTKTVEGTVYNIARFNLTFIRDTRLLTQTQLAKSEAPDAPEFLKHYRFRTNNYLSDNYELLTKLDFDYDESVANLYGQGKDFYPFPETWTASSYAFYDGSDGKNFSGKSIPQWGYYAIMKDFLEAKYWYVGSDEKKNKHGKPLPNSTYHMYIDASNHPGVIARLPFKQKLCKGSEMFVTAWVKSAGYDRGTEDAGMLFSVMGVTTDQLGQTAYEPIYRHASGQIRRSDYLNLGEGMGTGSGTNDWMQVYISFIIDQDAAYDSYVLQVDNNSASTNGGDMYIDDIRVYMARPTAKVLQLEATCTSERTLMNVQLDWNRLLSRLGADEVTDNGQERGIDYCFIDKEKYEQYKADHPNDPDLQAKAIAHAVVEVGDNHNYNGKYNTLYFRLPFDRNRKYEGKHPILARENYDTLTKHYYFYGATDEAGIKSLAVDFYSDLIPNRSYLMLIQEHGAAAPDSSSWDNIDDACSINTPFFVTSQTLLRVNGEVVDPTTDFCEGQAFSFSANVRVPCPQEDGTEEYKLIENGVYFDWFFGTEAEFLSTDSRFGNLSLQAALMTFREVFPDRENLDGITPGSYPAPGSASKVEITENHLKLLGYYLDRKNAPATGNHPRLVLHKEKLDIAIIQGGLHLVLQPIHLLTPPDGTVSEEEWAKICWTHIPLELPTSSRAPVLRAGFNDMKYPTDIFNPSLRIGLNQIKATSPSAPLHIDLRGARLVSEGASSLGLITTMSPDVFNKIYLVDTDDPAYKAIFPEKIRQNTDRYSYPVGTITLLQAKPYEEEPAFYNHMEVYFNTTTPWSNGLKFEPKEGYTYTLAVNFEEKQDASAGEQSTVCFGTFPIDMKVVPEYMVWQGNDKSNWNNDRNWKRADRSRLKKSDTDPYPTNQENTTENGFVPMAFSHVVMPTDSRARLYMAGYGMGGDGWNNHARPADMEAPTKDIQYDLMTYEYPAPENWMKTGRYRVNICRDVHFEPRAQMLHAEQLIYRRAWTDVEVQPNQWQVVSTPLHHVVAGDWYAPAANGRQETEYFKPVVFNADGYNRLNPAVYQRSWDADAKIVEQQAPAMEVSFAGRIWSSAYNDASVPYSSGCGFSVKGIRKATPATPLLFRFPKEDVRYDVATNTADLDRSQAGKLLISEFLDRSVPNKYNPKEKIQVKLDASTNGYHIVGNPFMASLDLTAFFAENHNLQPAYWTGGPDGPEVGAASDNGWTAVSVTDGQPSLTARPVIPPYGAFFVRETEGLTDAERVVTFKTNMQVLPSAAPAAPRALWLKAVSDRGVSSAAVAYAKEASDGYDEAEDAVLMQDEQFTDSLPLVYTIAGDRAVSINHIDRLTIIPLGVFASEGQQTTIEFGGTATMQNLKLYDAQTGKSELLTDGYRLTLTGASHGRYFLRADAPVSNIGQTEADAALSVYSVVRGQVIVSSSSAIRKVEVYAANGTLQASQTFDAATTCRIENIASGVALVKVITSAGNYVRKIRVK